MAIHSWSRTPRTAVAALSVFLTVLASCGGGGAAKVPRVDAASKMTTTADGYGFANFSAAGTSEEFGTDDLVAMFGNTEEVCTGGAEPCSPTPEAAAFARMVNQERASGHCEGLVATAASRFIQSLTPVTGQLAKDTDVVHTILQMFATQFLPDARESADSWAAKPLDEIVSALQENLAKNSPTYTLNLYTADGGHALLPIAVNYPDPDTAVVHVYDSNWPGKDRYVTVDLKKKEWSFSFSGQDPANDPDIWTGGKGNIDLTSMESRTSGSCPFCAGDGKARNSTLVIRSADDNVKVTTADGTVSPSSPTAGGTTMRPLAGPGADPGEGQPRDYVVSVPPDSKTVVEAGSQARIVALSSGSIAEAQTPESGTAQPVEFTPTGVSVDDPAVSLTLAAGDYVATSSGSNNSIAADATGVTATVDGAAGVPVRVTASPEAPAVEITGAGAPGLPDGADHVTRTQSTDGQVEQTVVDASGKETKSSVEGQLPNTSTSANLPPKLAAPEEVPGLPPVAERTGTATDATTTTTSSTVAAGTGDGDGTTANTSTTRTTVKPKSTTTVAQKTTQRTAVSVGINLDEWSFGPNDSASSGFTATLAATDADTATCTTAACLEGMSVDTVSTGTDPATNRTVTSTATFTMKSASVPFSVRCGTKGAWTTASASGGLYSATCVISSLMGDETVYLRA